MNNLNIKTKVIYEETKVIKWKRHIIEEKRKEQNMDTTQYN